MLGLLPDGDGYLLQARSGWLLLFVCAIKLIRFIPPRKKFPPDYFVHLAQASFLAG